MFGLCTSINAYKLFKYYVRWDSIENKNDLNRSVHSLISFIWLRILSHFQIIIKPI